MQFILAWAEGLGKVHLRCAPRYQSNPGGFASETAIQSS